MKNANILSDGDELLEIVDRNGKVRGLAKRSEIHGNPSFIHRVVHVLVFDKEERLLLQKRSQNKDIAPGKWDTSVGGHVHPREDILDAARREMEEELGITECALRFLYSYLFSNQIESELVSTFSCEYNGKFLFNRDEIDEIAFWDIKKIRANLGRNIFSAHFEKEISTYWGSCKTP
ncbi:MAG: nudix hydrolase 3 [Nitrospirae bacterium]|nr:nudix hydrolase 3 [Nitrospirota bacterium]